jgi:phage-related minor tail protein
MGMAQVAQIKSASFSGRAVGGSVTAGVPYMVGEQGQEMFIPSTNGQIVKNSDLSQGGASQVNVSFTINAVDTAGFDQLLASRRGQIVGMINRAMNDRGRAGVV